MKHALLVGTGVVLGLAAAFLVGSAPPAPQAGPGPGTGASGPNAILATGGASSQQNELCWVLTKVKPAKGPERTVLALYRAMQQGAYFDLVDVRMIDAELRMVEFKKREHMRTGTDVQTILKKLPPDEQKALVPPRPPGN